jgi:ABC-type uncharacterized transport system permease subunit
VLLLSNPKLVSVEASNGFDEVEILRLAASLERGSEHPLAIVFFALLVGGISASGGLMQRRFDMPDAATQVLQGIIFLCVLASNALYGRIRFFREAGAAA